MPIYEYECTSCGIHFERHQRISDDPIAICPECAGQVRRIIQPVGVIFKGSGFYVTDNRRISGGSGRTGKSADDASDDSKTKSPEPSTSKSESKETSSKSKE
jgi:putative FmdB family regulatory protein